MKKPTSTEIRLLAILAIAIFLIANVFMVRLYLAKTREASARLIQLQRTADAYQATINQRSYWAARQEWMLRMPPDTFDGSKTEAAFAGHIQQSLTSLGLQIDSQKLNDSRVDGSLVITELDLTVKANLEQIVRWLHGIQQPGRYLVIGKLNLRLIEGESTVMAQTKISKISRVGGVAKSR